MNDDPETRKSVIQDIKKSRRTFINKGNERKVRMRRFHTKSRNGCFSCKKLRIKCDENKPACHYCTTRNKTCVYPSRPSTNATKKQQFIELEFFSSTSNSISFPNNDKDSPGSPDSPISRRSSSPLTPTFYEFPRPTESSFVDRQHTNYNLLSPTDDSLTFSSTNETPLYRTIKNSPNLSHQEGLPYGDIVCFFKAHISVVLGQNDPAQLYVWSEVVPQLAANEPLLSSCMIAYTALFMKLGRTWTTFVDVKSINRKLQRLENRPKSVRDNSEQSESLQVDFVTDSTASKLDEIAYNTYSRVLSGLSTATGNVSSTNALSLYLAGVIIAAFSVSESPPVSLATIKHSQTAGYNKYDSLPDLFEIIRGTHDLSTLVYPYIFNQWSLISSVFPFEISERFTLDNILSVDLMNDKRLFYFLPIFEQITHMERGNRSLCPFITGETTTMDPTTIKVINKLVKRAFDNIEVCIDNPSDDPFGLVSGELESATVMTFLLIHYFLQALTENKSTILWSIFRDASAKYLELLRQNRQLEITILAYVCGLFEATQFIPGLTFIRNFNITVDHVSTEWRPALFWPLKYFNMVAESDLSDPWLSLVNRRCAFHQG